MRADKRSGGASIEMLKTARHTASRQNAKRSRSGIASVDQVIRDGRFGDALGSRVALSTNLLALPPKIAGTGRCSWAHRNACPDEARGRAVPLYLPFQIKSLAKIGLRLHDLLNERHVSARQHRVRSLRASTDAVLCQCRGTRFCPTGARSGVPGRCEPHHNGTCPPRL